MWVAMANFFFSTWEEYYTGTLYLGIISGPVEGIVMLVITFAAAGYLGTLSSSSHHSRSLRCMLLNREKKIIGTEFFEQPWNKAVKGTFLSSIQQPNGYTVGEVIALSTAFLMLFCILMAYISFSSSTNK